LEVSEVTTLFSEEFDLNYDIQLSRDNENWITIKEKNEVAPMKTEHVHSFKSNISGRFLRISFQPSNNTSISIGEVKVMGITIN
jgi:hypothetical protein